MFLGPWRTESSQLMPSYIWNMVYLNFWKGSRIFQSIFNGFMSKEEESGKVANAWQLW